MWIWPFRRVDNVVFVFCTKFVWNICYSHWDRRTYASDIHLVTSRELTFGFDFWSRGYLCVAVMHHSMKFGAAIFIQSGVIDIFPFLHPRLPIGEIFFTQSEYFTISNCVFNFNILALVVSEILGGSQIYVRGPCAPCTPLVETFLQWRFQFQLSSSCIFRDIRGSRIYTRGPYAPWTPPSGEFFLPKTSTSQYLIVFLISTF